MNTRLITTAEIEQRQQDLRIAAHRARTEMTLTGLRQLIGSTFIAMGTRLYGCMEQKQQIGMPADAVPARGL